MESVRNLFLVLSGVKTAKNYRNKERASGGARFLLSGMTVGFVKHTHIHHHFFVHIFCCTHSEIVIELLRARHLRNAVETEIVVVCLIKHKTEINKIFSYAGEVNHSFFCSKCNHAFGWMYCGGPDAVELCNEYMEQLKTVFTLPFEKIHQLPVVAGMRLICFDELLVAERTGPHACSVGKR